MANLLIVTQKVDKEDLVLGFFHAWIEEFSKHYEKLTVICLHEGDYDLPDNVQVLSLGKELGQFRSKYLWNFYKYIWQKRKKYNVVFVHMNQEYVLLGGLFWLLFRKKIYLWRNHNKGNFLTYLAVIISHVVFYTSSESYTARFKKAKIMPVGVDTELFKPDSSVVRQPRSILALGRISPVKHLEVLIGVLLELQRRGEEFSATIVGSPVSASDKEYEKKIHQLAKPLVQMGKLFFKSGVPHYKTPDIYRANEIFVNLTPPGSFDKTIIEAMVCETVVVISNQGLGFNLADKLSAILNWSIDKKINEGVLEREKVEGAHNLRLLVRKVKKESS